MQYTENHSLPQWEANDPIQRGDFNGAMESIDAALGAHDTTLAGHGTALAAAFSPDNMPYVVGTYKGNNSTKEIALGFQPSFLVITGDKSAENGTYRQNELGKYFAVSGPTSTCDSLTITETGFQVLNDSDIYPLLSTSGRTYSYIAFR